MQTSQVKGGCQIRSPLTVKEATMMFITLTFSTLALLVLNVESYYTTYGLSPAYPQERSPWIQVPYTILRYYFNVNVVYWVTNAHLLLNKL